MKNDLPGPLPLAALALLAGTASALAPAGVGVTSELDKVTASDAAAADQFGEAVALDGLTLVVGSGDAGGTGQAYVYDGLGGTFSEVTILTALDAQVGDLFGVSVGIDGNRIVVGAQWSDPAGTINAGAAYVFADLGGGWVQEAKLEATDAADFDWFGKSVAIRGDTVIVGAPFSAPGGAAYVFVRSGGVWSQQQKLVAADVAGGDFFGWSVDVDGDTAIVGSEFDDDSFSESGSAYVFDRSGGVWSQSQKLNASNPGADHQFGVSVALDGDRAVVGAIMMPFMAPCCTGSAYVFERSGGVWSETAILVPGDAAVDDGVGVSVDVQGAIVAVGAWMADQSGAESGSAYIFEYDGLAWNESLETVATDNAAGDWFGGAVSLSGGWVAVGAEKHDSAGADAGAAYVFTLTPDPGFGECFGVGCPCGNDDPTAGCANSTGSGGRLSGVGSTSTSSDDLVLTATNIPLNNQGLFYMGSALVSNPFFDGLQCALGTTFRFLGSIQSSGATGTMTYTGWVASSVGLIVPGTTWRFHCWHRDANGGSPCGTGANLTHVYTVTFTP